MSAYVRTSKHTDKQIDVVYLHMYMHLYEYALYAPTLTNNGICIYIDIHIYMYMIQKMQYVCHIRTSI
jgi:hypothetical protein